MLISLMEGMTEFYAGHTIYVVKVEHNRREMKVKVKRDGSKYTIDAKDDNDLSPGLEALVLSHVRGEFNKLYSQGDY